MTRDDITRMALEAGLKDLCGLETTGWPGDARVDALVIFAEFVAAAEREAILGLADSLGWVDVDRIRARE